MDRFLTQLRAACHELRRRHVFRVAGVYALVAWMIIQPTATILPQFESLPDWTIKGVIVLTLLGFPIALLLAWAYETTPEGVRPQGRPGSIEVPAGTRSLSSEARSTKKTETSLLLPLALLAGALCLLFGGGSWLVWYVLNRPPAPSPSRELATEQARQEKPLVAVHPMEVIGPDGEGNPHLSRAMSQLLISTLADVRGLTVMAATFDNGGPSADPLKEGERTPGRPDAKLEGSVIQRSDDDLVVTLNSFSSDNIVLWSEQFETRLEGMNDLSAFQREVVKRVAEKLQVELGSGDRRRIDEKPTDSLEAYTDYLNARYNSQRHLRGLYAQGRNYWNQRTVQDIRTSQRLFEQAIEADGDFAPAYAGLADTYVLLGYLGTLPPHEAYPQARKYATKAQEFDPRLAEAFTPLAYVRFAYEWDWEAAENTFRKALGLNREYPTAHHWYSWFLSALGRHDQAIEHAEAAKSLAPYSPIFYVNQGWCHYYAGQYDQAIQEHRRALDRLDPNFVQAHTDLGLAHVQKGSHDRGVFHLERAAQLSDESPFTLAMLGYGYAEAGQADQSEEMLHRLESLRREDRYIPAAFFATIYAGLNRVDDAFDALEEARRQQSEYMTTILVDPVYEGLRSDPRFEALVEKVGLPQF